MTRELWKLDAMSQAALVRQGEVSALELVDAAIARIEALDPALHALESDNFEAARALARNPPDGPLRGVPFLMKDLLPYPGLPCTMGSRLFRQHIPSEGSDYTARLQASGLIPLGKTTTSEFGLLGSTESLLSGITRNPWNRALSATGSSGGSACAVASGMVPVAHASDGGGSIRIPASACGLFGLKPSRGRCVAPGQSFAYDMLCDHFVTRSVRDSALLLSLLESERPALDARLGYVSEPIQRSLRIGVYQTTACGDSPTHEVSAALFQTVALCQELGHHVEEIAPPSVDGPALSEAFFTLAGQGMSQLSRMMTPVLGRAPGPDELEPFTLALIAWYASLPADSVARAIAALDRASATYRAFLSSYDVVLSPTIPSPPPPLATLAPSLPRELLVKRTEYLAGYTPLASIAGVPAMSVPLCMTPSGLPIGSHFVASLGAESLLLRLAYQLEQAASWHDRWPPNL